MEKAERFSLNSIRLGPYDQRHLLEMAYKPLAWAQVALGVFAAEAMMRALSVSTTTATCCMGK
jgi:hypothetical protein